LALFAVQLALNVLWSLVFLDCIAQAGHLPKSSCSGRASEPRSWPFGDVRPARRCC
jgi:hypothetical protein